MKKISFLTLLLLFSICITSAQESTSKSRSALNTILPPLELRDLILGYLGWEEFQLLPCHDEKSGKLGPAISMAFSADSTYLALGFNRQLFGLSCQMHMFKLEKNKWNKVQLLYDNDREYYSIAFSPNGKYLAAGSIGRIILWHFKNNKWEYVVNSEGRDSHSSIVHSIIFSPDNIYLASAAEDKTIKIWQQNNNNLTCTQTLKHTHVVDSLAFSSDGMQLASGSRDKTIRIWEKNNKDQWICVQTLLCYSEMVTYYQNPKVASLSFSSDGRYLVGALQPNTIKVWQYKNNQWNDAYLHKHAEHENYIQSALFISQDNQLLVTYKNGTPGTWQLQNNQLSSIQRDILCHNNKPYIDAITVSPDGNYIAVAFQAPGTSHNMILKNQRTELQTAPDNLPEKDTTARAQTDSCIIL